VSEPIEQTRDIDTLSPHPRNYNQHPPEQIERLAASLRQFGQVRPIVVHGDTIVAGHGVYLAAQHLGYTSLRVTQLTHLPDDWTEEQAMAYLVADNETRRGAEPDDAELAALLDELQQADFDIAAMGFDDAEYGALLDGLTPELPEPGNGGDEFEPDEAASCRVQPGDVWLLGGVHRLICGDCTDPATVERLMQGERASFSEVDPPYEMGVIQQVDALELCQGTITLWGMAFELSPVCLEWQNWPDVDLVWRFHFGRMYSGQRPFCHHRNIWIFNIDYYNAEWRGENGAPPSTFFESSYTSVHHKHEKPLDVLVSLLQQYSSPESLVYVPFGGSGATLIAAHRTGRIARMIEIDPGFCEIILQRCEAEGLTVEKVEA
jgi:site-specific DNA-methyltransferase (adenine-specific)